jgi:hypothetical protein
MAGQPDVLELHGRDIAGPELAEVICPPEEFETARGCGNSCRTDRPAIDAELQQVFVQVIMKGEGIPVVVELAAVDGKTDAGKILTDNDLEIIQLLVVDEIDVLIVTVFAGSDNAKDVAEVYLVAGEKAKVKAKVEIVIETKGVVGSEIQRSPLFLDYFMTTKDQTVGLGEIAGLK